MYLPLGQEILGSPPHTWRIQNGKAIYNDQDGITSTYVENTAGKPTESKATKDHLHIRGEYQFFYLKNIQLIGSPPHTWRIPFKVTSFSLILGITSTYVENTVADVLHTTTD